MSEATKCVDCARPVTGRQAIIARCPECEQKGLAQGRLCESCKRDLAGGYPCIFCGKSRSDGWTWQGVLFLTLLVGFIAVPVYGVYWVATSVLSDPSIEDIQAAFELMAVVGESPAGVSLELGAPVEVVPIENVPENMPGEFRDYAVPGLPDLVNVRFLRNRAVFVTVILPEQHAEAYQALARVGIDLSGVPPSTRAARATWWRDGGVPGTGKVFTKIGALRGMNGAGDGFDMIQAELRE